MSFIMNNILRWVVGLPFAIIFSLWRFMAYFIMLKDISNSELGWPHEWEWGIE